MPFLPLIFCLFLGASQAALYSLQDQRPGLAVTGQAEALEWWEGGPAFALASAGALRLNFRGLHVYPAKAALRPLDGWHAAACNASAWALCAADVGQVLPYASPRVPERQEDGWNDLACADARGKLLVTQGVYDISACDVFDEGLDLVFAGNVVYHRHSTLELWEYWLLVVLAIVLVRFLSHNIQALWDPAPDPRPQLPALICVLLVLAVVLVDGDHHFVTSADQVRAPILAPSGGVSRGFLFVPGVLLGHGRLRGHLPGHAPARLAGPETGHPGLQRARGHAPARRVPVLRGRRDPLQPRPHRRAGHEGLVRFKIVLKLPAHPSTVWPSMTQKYPGTFQSTRVFLELLGGGRGGREEG
jgi:hypothetical protein